MNTLMKHIILFSFLLLLSLFIWQWTTQSTPIPYGAPPYVEDDTNQSDTFVDPFDISKALATAVAIYLDNTS